MASKYNGEGYYSPTEYEAFTRIEKEEKAAAKAAAFRPIVYMPWSLELYQQTNARLWRQGQRAESVVIQHLTAAGTIDEDIMLALTSKDLVQSKMMEAVKARLK